MKDRLLTTREISKMLGISEKQVIELTENGEIPHFKVAGEFLRFKKDDVIAVKRQIQKQYNVQKTAIPAMERFRDFFYFNDFYIISTAVIIFLLWIIIKG